MFYTNVMQILRPLQGGIAWRIWRVDEETRESFRESGTLHILEPSEPVLRKTLKVVIESGLIYSLASVSVFVSHVLQSNVKYIATAVVRSLSHGFECEG